MNKEDKLALVEALYRHMEKGEDEMVLGTYALTELFSNNYDVGRCAPIVRDTVKKAFES